MAKKAKALPAFACSACGTPQARWAGKCPACGELGTVKELSAAEAALLVTSGQQQTEHLPGAAPLEGLSLSSAAAAPPVPRLASGLGEFDRVLGGGLVPGGVVLLGGEPGIGKSTLLLQAAHGLAATSDVLYVTAEEAPAQVAARSARLGALADRLHLAPSTSVERIAATLRSGRYRVIFVDSIQMVGLDDASTEPGSVASVRASATQLVEAAKAADCALVLVGHVTKDGELAGPRLLEHLVDAVLHLEGDRYGELRTLRALKNRYGSVAELGLLRMGSQGLEAVADASGVFIADRQTGISGSAVVPGMQGNRCLLVEVQALVSPSYLPQPVRKVSGLDPNRVAMVLAVLGRRLGLGLGNQDVYVNATGGARLFEPAADLAIALAVASSLHDRPLPADVVVLGEVGLGGELRPAPQYDLRASEARRLGFQRLLGPGRGEGRGRVKAKTLMEALTAAWGEEAIAGG